VISGEDNPKMQKVR